MSLSGAVELVQNGITVDALDLTNSNPLAVAVVDTTGTQLGGFDPSRPASATLTNVTVTNTSVLIAAANPARRQLMVWNDGGNVVYVAFAATATTTAFTVRISPNQLWESTLNGYTGDVSAIRASGSGPVRVTEVTT